MNEIIQTAKNILGFADAISYIINYVRSFLAIIMPDNIAIMFGIAFTVIVAISVKRGVAT